MSTFSIIALLLSVFNIIDMLVSNANNNNNRNNINQNDFNANDNSNTESNANPDQASSNAVSLEEGIKKRFNPFFWHQGDGGTSRGRKKKKGGYGRRKRPQENSFFINL